MKNPPRHHAAAFTLIELMVSITIIIILAGLVIAGTGFVNEKQARSQAKVQIALLEKAIQEYHMDMGRYPGTDANSPAAGNISGQLYDALFYDGWHYQENESPRNANAATKIYVPELDPRNSKLGWVDSVTTPNPPTSTPIRDPWGQPYRYRKGRDAVNPDFDLWSLGKDGQTNAGSGGTYDSNNRFNLDDIRNF